MSFHSTRNRQASLANVAMAARFRGFLPIVVDAETSGLCNQRHALLQLAANIPHKIGGSWQNGTTVVWDIMPFAGAQFDDRAAKIHGIDVENTIRLPEATVLVSFFMWVQKALKWHSCQRAIMVAHNAAFDLGFLQQAVKRTGQTSPFHSFSVIDTASLAALVCGHTVLAESCRRCGINFDQKQAHDAGYDVIKTTQLFCYMLNWADNMGQN